MTEVLCTELIFPLQKHVMTSEKWLDGQVSASLQKAFIIFDKLIYKPISNLLKEHVNFHMRAGHTAKSQMTATKNRTVTNKEHAKKNIEGGWNYLEPHRLTW